MPTDGRFELTEGGTMTMPMADQFWGDYFGSLTDRFGINWMVNYSAGAGQQASMRWGLAFHSGPRSSPQAQ